MTTRRRAQAVGLALAVTLLLTGLLARRSPLPDGASPHPAEPNANAPDALQTDAQAFGGGAGERTGLRPAPPADAATPAPQPWRVRGRVTDVAGSPVADAGVVLTVTHVEDGDRSAVVARTRTSLDGTFRLAASQPPPAHGLADACVAATALDGHAMSLFPSLASLPVDADGASVADLVVFSTGTLRGRVTDDGGTPVQDAEVLVWTRWPDEGTSRRRFPCAPDGTFAVPGLAGHVSARALAPGHACADGGLSGTVPIGGTLRLDLRLLPTTGTLRLRCVDPHGEPVPGVRIRAGNGGNVSEERALPEATSDGEGRVTLGGLFAGDHVEIAIRDAEDPWCFDPSKAWLFEVSADATPPYVDVPVVRGSWVRGRVRASTGESIGEGFVVLLLGPQGSAEASTDAAGRIAFATPIPARPARLEWAGLQVPREVDLTPGSLELDVVVDPCVRVEVHVLRPGGGPLCARWPHEPETVGLVLRVEGAVDGRQESHPLALVRPDGVFVAWVPTRLAHASRVVFRLGGASPRELAVSPAIGRVRTGGTARVDLVVPAEVLATVRGRLFIRGSATPITNSLVQLQPLDAGPGGKTRHAFFWSTDRFEVPLVPPGRYELRVNEMEWAAARTLTVPEGGILDLGDVELERH